MTGRLGRTILREGRKVYQTPAQIREAARAVEARQLATVGEFVFFKIVEGYNEHVKVTLGETTSNAPRIRIDLPDGRAYHVTITKARGKK